MGVIFSAADDVEELLIPFVRASGGILDAEVIRSRYIDASLGAISADEFWFAVGLNPTVEDEYLSKHSLMLGVKDFLQLAKDTVIPVWCLSNDVDRWSRNLRTSLEIDALLSGAVISSEVKSRKPSPAIYQCLLERSGYHAGDILFVDDREKNVEAALAMGIPCVKFSRATGYPLLARQVFGNAP
jgi:FMN phosphatase YigB (HAD superfamily)